jgi:hypothetical protein
MMKRWIIVYTRKSPNGGVDFIGARDYIFLTEAQAKKDAEGWNQHRSVATHRAIPIEWPEDLT